MGIFSFVPRRNVTKKEQHGAVLFVMMMAAGREGYLGSAVHAH
jgi:hypothetical protein